MDIFNKKFGKLKPIEKDINNKLKVICECDCGNIKSINKSHLVSGNIKSCGCISKNKNLSKQWKGCGDISGNFWYNHILRSARGDKQGNKIRKPKEINIDIEYSWNLFIEQNKKCSLSGLDLKFPLHGKDLTYTASLDRIDSNQGYIKGNVQWVHKHINIMKNKFNNDYFIDICKKIANNKYEQIRSRF